jgi:hypothetical protein
MSDKNRERGGEPADRARSGVIGRCFPRTGTEPVTAQSPLGVRLFLSGVFLPVFAGAAVFFGVWAANSGPGDSPGPGLLSVFTAVCAAVALLAAVDLVVVVRRLGRERRVRPPSR